MVATSTLSSIAFMPIESDQNKPKKQWFKPSTSSNPRRGLNFKANVQASKYINSNSLSVDDVSPGTLTSRFSNLSLFFGAITTIFEKPNRRNNDIFEEFGISGKFEENGLVFCQNFSIRSYEVGADGTISLETLISQLQETGLNHLKVTGLLGDGLGSTPEMCKRKLFWVSTKMQIVIDRYPTWGDTIQVDNWLVLSGKNTLRRDSIIRDSKTGEIMVRATSNWVMMSKETRRLCRFPEEVRDEMGPFCRDAPPNLEIDCRKLPKLDDSMFDYTCLDLKPRWSDLDINQHVNNAKYIGWILESAPASTLKSHKLSRMTLEYKRECQRESILHSMTSVSSDDVVGLSSLNGVECNHLLKLEDGAEIMKARTQWLPKYANVL